MAVLFQRDWIRTMEMLDGRLSLKWGRWWSDLLQVGLAQISQQIFNFVQSFWHCLIQNLMVGFVSERLSQNYGDVKLLGGFSLRRCCSEVFNCAMHNRLGFVQNYCHIDLPGLQDSMVLNGEGLRWVLGFVDASTGQPLVSQKTGWVLRWGFIMRTMLVWQDWWLKRMSLLNNIMRLSIGMLIVKCYKAVWRGSHSNKICFVAIGGVKWWIKGVEAVEYWL